MISIASPHRIPDAPPHMATRPLFSAPEHAARWLADYRARAPAEDVVGTDPAWPAMLAELAAQGVRVGLSTSGPRQADTLRRALEVRVDGVNPLSVVQATWNVLDPSAGAANLGRVRMVMRRGALYGREELLPRGR